MPRAREGRPESKKKTKGKKVIVGRPRIDDEPKLPRAEVYALLVDGEVLDGVRRWPSLREVARSYGASVATVSVFAARHGCLEKRAEVHGVPVRQKHRSVAAGEPAALVGELEDVSEPEAETETHGLLASVDDGVATEDTLDDEHGDDSPGHGLDVESSDDESGIAEDDEAETPEADPFSNVIQLEHKERRIPGRPRKGDAPLIPFAELDRLLVFGEQSQRADGVSVTTYPSIRELAQRYEVVPSVIHSYAKSHNCLRRRRDAKIRIAFKTEEELIKARASAFAVTKEDAVRIIDEYVSKFEKALKEDRIRFDNPNDLDKMLRLKEFLLGGADSRKEVHGTLSLVAIQQRYGRMLNAAREASPDETGIVDVVAESVSAADVELPELESGSQHTLPSAES